MDVIDRYVYAVVCKLPEKERKEVEEEIKGLIDDIINSYEENLTYEEKVYKALKELGDPEILADNYRGEKRYLIGPKYFHRYIYVLKIVLLAVFLGITVATIVEQIFNGPKNTLQIVTVFTVYISSLFSGAIQGAVWVTGIFAIIEYNGVDIDGNGKGKNTWDPSNLPEIPNKKSRIKPSESIIGIVATTIFFIVVYFMPQHLGAYITINDEIRIIPIFNLDAIKSLSFVIIILFILGISKELTKLIAGKWTIKSAVIYSILSGVSTALLITFLLNPKIWNTNFITEISRLSNIHNFPITNWSNLLNACIIIIIIIAILDILWVFFKSIKYSNCK
ncbi:putative membrane protein [Clostridium argentinense CDC 2741]|uniref:Putative membrane protein n=1 Tax=Clostridium argentinense CDC 2741 TaxID=1418104 RepID=A0A0C1R7L1_9CLOT|nr:hypothetical protein [Clostridium argentinense]ARC86020.1 hypothetical protein RSJ17_16735 [Clostridium argentinense]KIE46506.1 putative membrane protein [Clostridium argentinense CDC 2741]NFF38956.1 hypothetical protein [Clostridium argentinense]NFP48748.1 hypothetical protein [Clostridium argentinense]NFP70984.1 hypothetical protein [Clostridium argentinense]